MTNCLHLWGDVEGNERRRWTAVGVEPSLPQFVRVQRRPSTRFPEPCTPASVTFGIQSTESLLEGLGREVQTQVQRASEALTQPGDLGVAAHVSRRTLKKARALLKFARPALTPDVYRRGNHTMRDAGRCTARVRDADVLVETARSVRRIEPEAGLDDTWCRLLEDLETERAELFATAPGPDGPFRKARGLIGSIATGWPTVSEVGDRELLRVGLATSYGLVRAHYERAYREGADTRAHHELRKRAKDLRHQIEFLSGIAPDILEPCATELHQLSDLLGDGNDLVVLALYVDSAPGVTDARRADLLAGLSERREGLWKEAKRLGARVLDDGSDHFVGRVETCWVEARPQG